MTCHAKNALESALVYCEANHWLLCGCDSRLVGVGCPCSMRGRTPWTTPRDPDPTEYDPPGPPGPPARE